MYHSKRKSVVKLSTEINVAPLVDVLLVLLLVFMITAPMLISSIHVDLPEVSVSNTMDSNDQPLIVTIDAKGKIYLADDIIDKTKLITKLVDITKDKKDIRIFVKGDKNIMYGEVVSLIGQLQEAGFSKVALLSLLNDNKK